MPIRPYLDGHKLDAETIRVLGLAFEITRAALKIDPTDEVTKATIARKLIECAEQGVRDPEALSSRVLGAPSHIDRLSWRPRLLSSGPQGLD